ncbi:MAG: hydrogenase maturation protease [Candidatus Promineifilaceae bacterium]
MATTLLIGYGNPLRSDDGIGPAVAEVFAAKFGSEEGIVTIACHQLLPEHAEPISKAERVIFVDAEAGPDPGSITVRELEPDAASSAGLIHDFSPQTLLAYAQTLYGQAPPAVMVTVGGYSFAHGDSLSKEMAALLPTIVECITARLG